MDVWATTNPDVSTREFRPHSWESFVIHTRHTTEDPLIAAIVKSCTSLIGIIGALLNTHPLLPFYSVLLVPCFVTLIPPAYHGCDHANMKREAKMTFA